MVHGVSVRGPSRGGALFRRLRRWSVTLGSGYTPTFLTARSRRLEKNNLLVLFVKLNHISAASPPPPSRAGARSALPLEVMVVVPFTQVWRLLYDNLYIARDSVRNQLQRVLQVRPDEADGLLH